DQDHAFPELALRIETIDHDELEVEHLAAAVPRALEQAAFPGIAGADPEFHSGNSAVRNSFVVAGRWSFAVIESHGGSPLGLRDSFCRAIRTGNKFRDESSEVWLLDLLELSAAILRGEIPGIRIGADEGACRFAVAKVDPVHGDDLIDDRRQLARGLAAL